MACPGQIFSPTKPIYSKNLLIRPNRLFKKQSSIEEVGDNNFDVVRLQITLSFRGYPP